MSYHIATYANRADVKAEAAAANKAGTTVEGQESVPGQDKGPPKAKK